MTLGDITAKLTADINQFEAKMEDAKKALGEVEKEGGKAERGLTINWEKIGGVAVKAMEITAATIGAATTALGAYVTKATSTAARTETMGVAMEAVANATGNSMDELKVYEQALKDQGITTQESRNILTRFMQSQLDVADATGIARVAQDLAVIAGEDSSEMTGRLTDAIATMNPMLLRQAGIVVNQSELFDKYAEANNIAGRELTETEKKQAMVNLIMEEGEKVTGSYEMAMDTAGKKLGSLRRHFEELENVVGEQFLPIFGEAIDIVTSFLSEGKDFLQEGDFDGFVDVFIQAINDLTVKMAEEVPKFMEMAIQILEALIQGVRDNLPMLVESAMEIIDTLIRGLIDLLPDILQMGIDLLITLMDGLTETIPELIPLIVDMVLLMVETLIDNLPLILESGIELIIALLMGLIEALPLLIDYIPDIVEALVGAIILMLPYILYAGIKIVLELIKGLAVAIPKLVAMVPQLLEAIAKGIGENIAIMWETGEELIKGLWEGIKVQDQWIKDKLRYWVGDVTSFLKGLFGISSPSEVMEEEVGMNIGSGIANGIINSVGMVKNAMNDIDSAISRSISPIINPNVSASMSGGLSAVNLSINMSGANISSPEVAQEYAEQIGDAIIGKLRTNRRSYV
jgi:phage-related protein